MKRLLIGVTLATLGWLASAAAAEGHAQAGHEGKGHDDPAAYILHHVSDSREVDFQLPLSRENAPGFTFPVWRYEFKPGGCPADLHEPASLTAGCFDYSLSKNVFMLTLSSTLLLLIMVFGSHRDRRQLVPRGGLANFLEMMVLFVRNEIAVKNIGEKQGPRYTPFLLSIFFFILAANLLGLIPFMSTATGNLGVTAALAICVFFVTQAAAIRSAGIGGYLKHLTGGVHWSLWPLMIPVEIIGLFTKPFALTIRLFANMLAGHLVLFFLLGLIFFLGSAFLGLIAVPMAVGLYLLELFVAFVQAYIFTMLSAVFIGMGVAMGEHAHHDEGHGASSDAHGHAHEAAAAQPAAHG